MAPETSSSSLRRWIVEHDERWIFIGGYVTLAIVLSIWISLFWLLVVVGVHFAFEWVRQSHRFASRGEVLVEALWETKLDFSLVAFALALSLYIEAIFGLLGLRSAGQMAAAVRVGARAGTRAAGWQSAIRGILLSLDDAVHVVRGLLSRKKTNGNEKKGEEETAAPEGPPGLSFRERWGVGDWFSVALAVACVALILVAPWLTEHTWQTAVATLGQELHPFPE